MPSLLMPQTKAPLYQSKLPINDRQRIRSTIEGSQHIQAAYTVYRCTLSWASNPNKHSHHVRSQQDCPLWRTKHHRPVIFFILLKGQIDRAPLRAPSPALVQRTTVFPVSALTHTSYLSVCLSPPVCLSFCLVFLFISDFHIRIFPPSLSRSLSSSLQLCKHFQVRLSCQPTRQTQVLCAEGFIQYFLLVSELDTGVVKTEQKITVSGMLLKVWM